MKESEKEQLEGEERQWQKVVSREAGGKHSQEGVRQGQRGNHGTWQP